MYYTIGEMAEILGIPASTLRYYDKEGLMPYVERSSGGIRRFKEEDLSWLRVIECMKKTGMQLKDIRTFIEMIVRGDETIPERLEIIRKQRDAVREQLKDVQNTLDIIEYKYWYYETAAKAGTTNFPKNMDINDVPDKFRKTLLSLKKTDK